MLMDFFSLTNTVQAEYVQAHANTRASQVMPVVKNLPANAGDIRDVTLISGSGRYSGGGHATHPSILAWRIPMDKGVWWAIVHNIAKSQTWLKQLSMHANAGLIFAMKNQFFDWWKSVIFEVKEAIAQKSGISVLQEKEANYIIIQKSQTLIEGL